MQFQKSINNWFKDENNLSDSVPISEFSSNFANWRDGVKINLKANGYRLPTDAEWEFAARGGDPNEKDENENLIWFLHIAAVILQAKLHGALEQVSLKLAQMLLVECQKQTDLVLR